MLIFHLQTRSGLPPYAQLIEQVRQALLTGVLRPGRPAADGEGGRRRAGGQPQHRLEGLPRPRARGARRGPAGRRHVRRTTAGRPAAGSAAPAQPER